MRLIHWFLGLVIVFVACGQGQIVLMMDSGGIFVARCSRVSMKELHFPLCSYNLVRARKVKLKIGPAHEIFFQKWDFEKQDPMASLDNWMMTTP
jgi:hypothetical protein